MTTLLNLMQAVCAIALMCLSPGAFMVAIVAINGRRDGRGQDMLLIIMALLTLGYWVVIYMILHSILGI